MSERLLIGAHLSTGKGLPSMLHTAVSLGAACVQIFTSSPQQWRGKQYTAAEADAFRAALAETGVGPVVSHESYLINLASSDEALLEKSRASFREEIARCGMLGLPALIIHWGSYKGGSLEDGLARLADSLNLLIPPAADAGVQIVLETTAGQGAYLGGEFAQFPQLFALVPEHRLLGVCLDTCHVFAAGYDLRNADQYAQLWQQFDEQVGLERLTAIHLNDSLKPLGSHGDRHAHIGQGELGLEAFRLLLRDPRLAGVPKILETPGGEEQHAENLRLLRELAGK
ncbi:MAG: deoxyribonuclease IV [Armatimonadota bacterium]